MWSALLAPVSAPAQPGDGLDAALVRWCERVEAAPADSAGLDSLQECAAAPAVHGTTAWSRAVAVLQRYPHRGRAQVVPRNEPGERLKLKGVVRDTHGQPVSGAVLHVFQTNAAGAYTPTRPMDEPQARLSAWIVTGPDGRYAIDTIRPGGYPKAVRLSGEDRKIPAHIHYEAQGGDAGRSGFQLVFADDPRLDAHWRRWAEEGGHPIVTVERVATGVWSGTCDVTLHR